MEMLTESVDGKVQLYLYGVCVSFVTEGMSCSQFENPVKIEFGEKLYVKRLNANSFRQRGTEHFTTSVAFVIAHSNRK